MPLSEAAGRYAERLFESERRRLSAQFSQEFRALKERQRNRGLVGNGLVSGMALREQADLQVKQAVALLSARVKALRTAYEDSVTLTEAGYDELYSAFTEYYEVLRTATINREKHNIQQQALIAGRAQDPQISALVDSLASHIERGLAHGHDKIQQELLLEKDRYTVRQEAARGAKPIPAERKQQWFEKWRVADIAFQVFIILAGIVGLGAVAFLIAEHRVAAIWTFYAVIILSLLAIGAYIQRHLWEAKRDVKGASAKLNPLLVGAVIVATGVLIPIFIRWHRGATAAMPSMASQPQSAESISPAVEADQTGEHNIEARVVDTREMPVRGVHVLLILPDGIHLGALTDQQGIAQLSRPDQEPAAVFCAHEGFSAFYKTQYSPVKPLLIKLTARPSGGSVMENGTGTVPRLEGRLNPILDSIGRTYLYADNIAINGGKTQPVEFAINSPFKVRDSKGHSFTLEIVAIRGSSSLIQYTRF